MSSSFIPQSKLQTRGKLPEFLIDGSNNLATGPKISLSPEEKRLFGQLFKQCDPDGFGVVTGDTARTLFERSGLPSTVLGEVWQLADSENNGFLDQTGFSIALRLIGQVQNGARVDRSLANVPGPLPVFDGKRREVSGGVPSPAILSPDPVRGVSSAGLNPSTAYAVPPLSPQSRQRLIALFKSTAPGGEISGEKARDIFLKAKLNTDTLGQIWNLADTQNRGRLNQTEFIIAMHLIQTTLDGTLKNIPPVLPPSLYEAALGRPTSGSSLRSPSNGSITGIASAAAQQPVVSQRASVQSPVQYPPRQQTLSPTTAAGQVPRDWYISPQEKARYNAIFDSLDTSKNGTIGPDKVAPFLATSKLSEDVLAHIWDLSDLNNSGEFSKSEFAIAMYLVQQKLSGKELPQVLPQSVIDSLKPPSRQSSVVGDNSPNPIFFGGNQQQPATSPPLGVARAVTSPQVASAPVNPGLSSTTPSASVHKGSLADLADLNDLFSSPPPDTRSTPALQPQSAQSADKKPQSPQPQSPQPQPLQRSSTQPPLQPQNTQGDTKLRQFVPTSSFGQAIIAENKTGSQQQITTSQNNEASSTELASLSNEIGDLNKKTTQIVGQREVSQAELSQVQAQKKEIEAKLASLKAAYDQEVKNVHIVQQSLVQTRAELTKLKEEYSLIEASYNAITSQHSQAAEALNQQKEEVLSITEKINSVKEETQALQKQLEEISNEQKRQQEIAIENQRQLAEAERQREQTQAEVEAAKKAAKAPSPPPAASTSNPTVLEVAGASGALGAAGAAAVVATSGESKPEETPTQPLEENAFSNFGEPASTAGSEAISRRTSPGNPFASFNSFTSEETNKSTPLSETHKDIFARQVTNGETIEENANEPASTVPATSTSGQQEKFDEIFGQLDIGSPSTTYPARSSTHNTEETPGSSPPLSDFAGPSHVPAFTLPISRPESTTSSVQNNAPLSVRGDIDTPGHESSSAYPTSESTGEIIAHNESLGNDVTETGQDNVVGTEQSVEAEETTPREFTGTAVAHEEPTPSAEPADAVEPNTSTPESYDFVEHEEGNQRDTSAPETVSATVESVPKTEAAPIQDVPSAESEGTNTTATTVKSPSFDNLSSNIPGAFPVDTTQNESNYPEISQGPSVTTGDSEFPPIQEFDTGDDSSSDDDDDADGDNDIYERKEASGDEKFLTPTSTREENTSFESNNEGSVPPAIPGTNNGIFNPGPFAKAVNSTSDVAPPLPPKSDDFFADAFVGLSEAKVDNDPNDSFDNDGGSYDFKNFSDFNAEQGFGDDTFTSSQPSAPSSTGNVFTDAVSAPAQGGTTSGGHPSTNDEWEQLFAGLGSNSATAATVEDDDPSAIDDAFTVKNDQREMSPHSLAISQLVGMGFSKEASLQALSKHNYDLAQATNYLLDNSKI